MVAGRGCVVLPTACNGAERGVVPPDALREYFEVTDIMLRSPATYIGAPQ